MAEELPGRFLSREGTRQKGLDELVSRLWGF